MRGTYFATHLKGNSGNFVDNLIENQATRPKVANAYHLSKVVASKSGDSAAAAAPVAPVHETKSDDDVDEFECDTTSEHQLLWQSAAESVLEYADRGEEQEDSDDNEYDNTYFLVLRLLVQVRALDLGSCSPPP